MFPLPCPAPLPHAPAASPPLQESPREPALPWWGVSLSSRSPGEEGSKLQSEYSDPRYRTVESERVGEDAGGWGSCGTSRASKMEQEGGQSTQPALEPPGALEGDVSVPRSPTLGPFAGLTPWPARPQVAHSAQTPTHATHCPLSQPTRLASEKVWGLLGVLRGRHPGQCFPGLKTPKRAWLVFFLGRREMDTGSGEAAKLLQPQGLGVTPVPGCLGALETGYPGWLAPKSRAGTTQPPRGRAPAKPQSCPGPHLVRCGQRPEDLPELVGYQLCLPGVGAGRGRGRRTQKS